MEKYGEIIPFYVETRTFPLIDHGSFVYRIWVKVNISMLFKEHAQNHDMKPRNQRYPFILRILCSFKNCIHCPALWVQYILSSSLLPSLTM